MVHFFRVPFGEMVPKLVSNGRIATICCNPLWVFYLVVILRVSMCALALFLIYYIGVRKDFLLSHFYFQYAAFLQLLGGDCSF